MVVRFVRPDKFRVEIDKEGTLVWFLDGSKLGGVDRVNGDEGSCSRRRVGLHCFRGRCRLFGRHAKVVDQELS